MAEAGEGTGGGLGDGLGGGLGDGPSDGPGRPRVSVVMANWRGARHIGEAVASTLRQTEGSLELIVADDGSDDGSEAAARAAAGGDPRLRWLPGPARSGPAAARNRALGLAAGDWIAVVDSDDAMHPRRIEILLALADREGADIVADDLLHFGEGPGAGGRTLLEPLAPERPFAVDAALWARSDAKGAPVALGYLKPVIRRSALGDARYDTSLRVGEDHDLVLRLLLGGARLVVSPLPLYLYRRHPGSVSHRLMVATVEAMLLAHRGLETGEAAGPLAEAMAQRGRSLEAALRFERLVEALKARRVGVAARALLADPRLVPRLAGSVREGLARRLARRAPPARPEAAAHLALVPRGAGLPAGAEPGVARDGLIEVPSLDDAEEGGAWRRLALRLATEAARRPLALTAVGSDGLDAAWLAPGSLVPEAWLAEGETMRSPLPPGAARAP